MEKGFGRLRLKIKIKKTVYLRFNVDVNWMETRISIYRGIIWNE